MNTSKGPSALIKASMNMELYDIETEKEVYREGICTLKKLKTEKNAKGMVKDVYTKVNSLINEGKFVVMLGGEHCITTGAVKAHSEKFKNLSVLQIDAHADLEDSFEGGGKYSHASVMARVKEICPIVQVGIRSVERKINGENIFFAKDLFENDLWMDKVVSQLKEEVYITIDLDGLDPSIMPAVGTPEPGGLQWYQTLKLLKKIVESKKVVGFDVVELAPLPHNIAPDFLAAKLVYKLLSYIF